MNEREKKDPQPMFTNDEQRKKLIAAHYDELMLAKLAEKVERHNWTQVVHPPSQEITKAVNDPRLRELLDEETALRQGEREDFIQLEQIKTQARALLQTAQMIGKNPEARRVLLELLDHIKTAAESEE
ncbi:MAG: hypothetical protein HYV42_00515 [Candidatus Magasanikbacteria bacterium]|nr:hypothetical protein [Candidatus Magasanikbacteria bacterium]